jgi:hypothetical protein
MTNSPSRPARQVVRHTAHQLVRGHMAPRGARWRPRTARDRRGPAAGSRRAVSSSLTASVTLETRSRDTSAPYTSARCAWIFPVVRPLAYSDKIAVTGPADPRVLRDHQRLEAAGPVPRHRDPHRPGIGVHRLRRMPVPHVRRPAPGRVALVIAQVIGQLGLQRRLQHHLRDRGQQPAGPGQLDPFRAGPADQLLGQLLPPRITRHRLAARRAAGKARAALRHGLQLLRVLQVEALDATLADLAVKGIVAAPAADTGHADAPRTSWITDPDGYRIELVQWPVGQADGITNADFPEPTDRLACQPLLDRDLDCPVHLRRLSGRIREYKPDQVPHRSS